MGLAMEQMNKHNARLKWFDEHFGSFPNFDAIRRYLLDGGFFEAPASTRYHGCYAGGLCDHSINVAEALIDLTKKLNLEWQRPESPLIIGFFHDLCKIDNYIDPNYKVWTYNEDAFYKGHGDKSLMLLSSLVLLTEEEAACIRYHMGAFTKETEWSDYTSAIHKFPNVLFTHTADMVAAHIMEIEG